MNKTDFRLGNLIIAKYYDENEVEQETIAEISGISEDALFGDEWTYMLTTGLETEDYHGMMPIKLTKEILLKIGFSFNFNSNRYENSSRLSISKIDECYLIEIDNTTIKEVHHVHELQNIFYVLTNQELKIEL